MGYNENDIFVGKDVDGNEICAGFRFTPNVPQSVQLLEAKLTLWLARAYPAGQAAYDSFTDDGETDLRDHTAELGPPSGWEQLRSYSLHTTGTVVKSNEQDTGHHPICVLDVGAADGTVIAYTDCGGAAQRGGGIAFRALDSDNYWLLWTWAKDDYPNQTISLQKRVGGSLSTVDTYVDGHLTHNKWLKVVLDGSSIKCYVDDALVFDVTDSDLVNETKHGVYIRQIYDSNEGWVDDFDFIPAGTPAVNLEAACHDVDDAPDFDAGDLPGDRVLTTAKVALGDISGWAEGQFNETVDIKAAIQEILDRPGWSAENGLAIILKPTDACGDGEFLRIASYEEDSSHAAELTLAW